jgi:hypothetical protein
MRPEHHCPDCGAILPADAPRGLCPNCLIEAALFNTSTGGFAPNVRFEPAGDGVLATIAQSIGPVSRVLLRDTAPGEKPGPIVRPPASDVDDRTIRYRIDGEIARGGMGAVLKGRDPDLGRMVGSFGEVQVMDWGLAKVLPRGGSADDEKAGRAEQQETLIATARSGSDSTRHFRNDVHAFASRASSPEPTTSKPSSASPVRQVDPPPESRSAPPPR